MGMTIISNYEMPSNCYMCDLHNYHECDLTGESIEEDYCWNGDSREKHCPLREVEAIPKADYENRLKADMVAMLTELKADIDIMSDTVVEDRTVTITSWKGMQKRICKLIQSKIDKLKEE